MAWESGHVLTGHVKPRDAMPQSCLSTISGSASDKDVGSANKCAETQQKR